MPNLAKERVQKDAALAHEPIVATVKYYSEKTSTIRYSPTGDPKTWEIGEPYIPKCLTHDGAERLRLIVLWDITSRGLFVDQSSIT